MHPYGHLQKSPLSCDRSPSMAASVFLSHAGEQKTEFAAVLYHTLCEENIDVFFDDNSLTLGDHAWPKIVRNLQAVPVGARLAASTDEKWVWMVFVLFLWVGGSHRTAGCCWQCLITVCCAAVVVLSKAYVRKQHPMMELQLLLKRKRAEKDSCCLLPVLYDITFAQCDSLATGYHCEPWVGKGDKPARQVLNEWAGFVRELLQVTTVREDQVLPFPGGVLREPKPWSCSACL